MIRVLLVLLLGVAAAHGEPPLIAHYSFDAGEPGVDESGNGYHGAGFGYTLSTGVVGQALSVDGKGGVIVDALKNFDWGDQLSVSFYFMREGGWKHYASLVNVGLSQDSSWEVNMGREDGGSAVWAGVMTFVNPAINDIRDVRATQLQWHHAALTYSGQELLFYLDGALQTIGVGQDSGRIIPSDNPLRIGWSTGGARDTFFVGRIDEVKVYRGVLSVGDIKKQFGVLAAADHLPEKEKPTPTVRMAAPSAPPPRAPAPARAAAPTPPTTLPAAPAPASEEPAEPPWQGAVQPATDQPDEETCCERIERWVTMWREGQKQHVIDEWNDYAQ